MFKIFNKNTGHKRTDSDLNVPSKRDFRIPDWMFLENEMQTISNGDTVINLQKEYPHSDYGRKGKVVDMRIVIGGQCELTVRYEGYEYLPHQKGHSLFAGSVIKI